MTEHHDMTAQEFFESLNHFDELAIAKAFGAKPVELSNRDAMAFARALVFVAKRREELSDADAKRFAFEATIGQVNEFFAPDEDDEDDAEGGEALTPAGKGDSSPVTSPTTSPGSVS